MKTEEEIASKSETPITKSESPKSPWPAITIALMVVGYAGYYLCRSDLSVARPQIIDQFKGIGITKESIGLITAIATALYALGKFIFGSITDLMGGRRMFLLGMVGAIVFTLMFGLGGPPLFLLAWCGNRFVQSSGWVGMVKITSRWFSYRVYGGVMGLVSMSFLFGDFASRLFLGSLITSGWTWQQVFYVSAGVLAVIFIPCAILLRNRPAERGLPDPEPNPESVFADGAEEPQRTKLSEILLPLLRSRIFWTACALSFGFTFMRETFNDWTPTFLHEVGGLSEGNAASASSLFPLFGGISVLAVGFLSDRLKKGGRPVIIAVGLALATIGLLFLANAGPSLGTSGYLFLTAAIAFVLIGPYSFLAGAISMDFGGTQGSATAAGWIDGIGYIGGILSGYLIGKVAEHNGWAPAFVILAVTAGISCLVAVLYWRQEKLAPTLA